jgi:hypothetical protein
MSGFWTFGGDGRCRVDADDDATGPDESTFGLDVVSRKHTIACVSWPLLDGSSCCQQISSRWFPVGIQFSFAARRHRDQSGACCGAIWMKCMGKKRGLEMTEAAETVWQGSGNEEVTSMDSTRIRLYQHNNLDNLRMRTVQEWDAGEDE